MREDFYDRAMLRRLYNEWRKFKKRCRKKAIKQLGDAFNEKQFLHFFNKEYPNPMIELSRQKWLETRD